MYLLSTVVYDPSVWTEAGYTLQRYIGNAAFVGIRIFVIIFGITLVPRVVNMVAGFWRK